MTKNAYDVGFGKSAFSDFNAGVWKQRPTYCFYSGNSDSNNKKLKV